MRRGRKTLLIICVLLVVGLFAGWGGFQWYVRRDGYRRDVQQRLSTFFGLPTDVGGVKPCGLCGRELHNVQMWLPGRRDRIFHAPLVIWDSSGPRVELDIHDAVLTVGSPQWQQEDYMRVLRASLLHNFDDLTLGTVRFHNATFSRPGRTFQISAEKAGGKVEFDPTGRGQADLMARTLNGQAVPEPIRIRAAIDPYLPDDFLPQVSLEIPALPLAQLGLDQVLGSPVSQGSFSGKVTLRQSGNEDTVELHGTASGLKLEELTGLGGPPVRGKADLRIGRGFVRAGQLEELSFTAQLSELDVDSLTTRLSLPKLGGSLTLEAYGGLADRFGLKQMGLRGSWKGISLPELARATLGHPGLGGRLNLEIRSLTVMEGKLASADMEAVADPGAGSRTIARDLLLKVMADEVGIELPAIVAALLPSEVPYERLGAKILIAGNQVHAVGLGLPPGGILVVDAGGRPMELIPEIRRTIKPELLVELARAHAARLKARWATQPAP